MLATSGTCASCRIVVGIVTDWISGNLGDRMERFDLSMSLVDIRLETDWHAVVEEGKSVNNAAHSDRVRISCSIPMLSVDTGTWQTQALTFFLQQAAESSSATQSLSSASDFTPYPSGTEKAPRPYIGRKRPLIADMTLFQMWKQLCQELHGEKCTGAFKGTGRIQPRVIDIHNRCLVFTKEDEHWACLSYVWGRTNALRLTKSNVEAFSIPGSLTSDLLPNIVEDALQLAKGLDEHYLWVDSFCIIQDEEEDKQKFISSMDSIYALATVVIIAATSLDANSYLPGLRPRSRYQEPKPFNIRNVKLVQSLDPVLGVKVDLRTGRAAAYLGETTWDTRAWTLQERFLAARSLVCTAEQFYWECEEAFWCEDSFRETSSISPDPHRTSLCGGELNLSWGPDVVTLDYYYRTLLAEYSTRSLSFDSDGLNAFSGVIRAFERSTGEMFFWGMPTGFLESAVAWGHPTPSLRRRCGIQDMNGSSQGNAQFPSWSWVGWTSDGNSKLDNQHLTTEPLGLHFYNVSEDGATVRPLRQRMDFNAQIDLLVEGSNIPDRLTRPSKISIEDLPADPLVALSSVLCFWTTSTTVSCGDHDPNSWEMTLSQDGRDVQVSWSQIPSLQPGNNVEIIALAQNRGEWDHGHVANGAIGVMVISWRRGVAFREGFAWIAIRDWTALKYRTWKLIVLA